ncbi:hypothetical protein C8Q76DRAFT_589030, partial [Earliella scabrosa]
RSYVSIVQQLDLNAKSSEFKIQNIVGSCDPDVSCVLEQQFFIAPDVPCSLIYRMIKPKVVLLILISSKIV